jgi:hypothetical protein
MGGLRSEDGDISLWKLYNLFTLANMANYIYSILEIVVNATVFPYHWNIKMTTV